jgi:endonuclease/exonuclease/phosphatase family metal-dependent hydrolase
MWLRLLTYNIHKAIGIDGEFAPERIVEILRYYDADIVLLQEVDRGAPRSSHLDLASQLARALRYQYRAVGMNVTLKKGRYGNATLTRFPIGRQRNIDLTVRWRKRRGAQHTHLHIPNGSRSIDLDVFNVHLGLSARERREQVSRLLDSPDVARLEPHAPCLIAGDMNDWPGVLKRRCFKPAGFECATNSPRGSRWSIKSFPSYAPTTGLDKIFYRGALRPLHVHRSRLKLARVASDHVPIIAEFEI